MINVSLVTFTAIPHHSAESIHMVMTAMELAKICKFKLVSPAKIWRRNTFSKDLSSYDVKSEGINHMKILQFFPNDTFSLRTIAKDKTTSIYCRQCIVGEYFLKRGHFVLLELHTLPNENEFLFLKNAFLNKKFIGLIVITESLKQDILDVIGNENKERVYVLPDAADVERFHFKPLSLDQRDRSLKSGYIGSNFPGKGWEIIEKLPSLTNKHFNIFGFSIPDQQFDNMIVHGKVPFSQVPEALDTFDIGLLPNQPSVIVANQAEIGKYTSPMKLFEYMASGKVIIASDLPVIREILKDSHNALLVPYNDPSAWIDAIERLNTDKDLYIRLQKQAYMDVCEFYSYRGRAKSLISIISNFIA